VEHLLLALTDDIDATSVMAACLIDRAALRRSLVAFIDGELASLVAKGDEGPVPTAGFHRVVQRAVIHINSSGRNLVTGANLLVAIFSEAESHALRFLQSQGMTRHDAVNFIAHGIRKGDAAA
jgi:ATP-dependent Clp protease ATP-binding subunit ClpA